MDYHYVACSEDNSLVKGKLSAASQEAASDMLAYSGYRVLSLEEITPFFPAQKLTARLSGINPREIIMFSRQLALLLQSGTDIVASLELLQAQVSDRSLKKVIADVVSDVRAGIPLSDALRKHPRAFSPIYHRLVAVGERTGNLEVVLRRAADYIERVATTQKSVKSALVYPAILLIVAIVVVGILVTFVLPAFAGLYTSFGVQLPAATRALLAGTDWLQHYGLWLLLAMVAIIVVGYTYTKTPAGRYQWGKLALTLPKIGHINLLNELSRCCRSMSLLYGSGLPLPEIMTLVIQGTNNKAMVKALTEVQQSMIAGQGLSGPMAKNNLFMPLMVQMTAVGEETGNLDDTLATVAESYEAEADDKTKAMVALITPAMTIFIGLLVGFIALSLVSAMYSIYGQVSI
ncbi:MAG: type II secretion system F family protein [Chloroflexi bacterium CG07_land_8_20_14_0_80_45_17]|nr:MAG: type II secretion system F family protein [Chloroflexi bacterium CG07_land_8_20_14_0_80_45_17]